MQAGDDPARLQALGLAFGRSGRATALDSALRTLKFKQPCAAHAGCRCRIYPERPQYCREFECVLLKSVKAGQTQPGAALGIIRAAHQRAEKVRRLLRELGDSNETVALGARFRRMARRLEKVGLDEPTADTYAQLTLAVHDLNLLLSQAFYPGESREP